MRSNSRSECRYKADLVIAGHGHRFDVDIVLPSGRQWLTVSRLIGFAGTSLTSLTRTKRVQLRGLTLSPCKMASSTDFVVGFSLRLPVGDIQVLSVGRVLPRSNISTQPTTCAGVWIAVFGKHMQSRLPQYIASTSQAGNMLSRR